jgi:6-phosphogluconolactonase
VIYVHRDHVSACIAFAERIAVAARAAIAARGRFEVVLCGGSTPERTYRALADSTGSDEALWGVTHVYWGDERYVPHDDPASNVRMARGALLDRVKVKAENVHPIPTDCAEPDACAHAYTGVFPEEPDLILLGMGSDGHTASLFPGSPLLDETVRLFAAATGPSEPRQRISATPVAIRRGRALCVLATGQSKAPALVDVFRLAGSVKRTPARLCADAEWFVDRDAAKELIESTDIGCHLPHVYA